jgi:penicillin-binding protein 2
VKSVGGVERPPGSAVPDLPFNTEHIDFIRNAMVAVTTTGTAHAFGDLGLGESVRMAGKTGTAQARGYSGGTGVHDRNGAWILRDHSWFICYAPTDEPRYAMSVLVEHGGFGATSAAPRAREIMRVALLKDPEIRARIEKPLPIPVVDTAAAVQGAAPPPPTDEKGNPVPQPMPDDGDDNA